MTEQQTSGPERSGELISASPVDDDREPTEDQKLDIEALAPIVELIGTHLRELERTRGELQLERARILAGVLLKLVYVGGGLLALVLVLSGYALYRGNDALAQGIVMAAFALFGGIGLGRAGKS